MGLRAPSLTQGVATAINHLFNTAFDWLSNFPANPISNFIEGGLVLIRRSLFFFVPMGVSASMTGNSLSITVNAGSVGYFRTKGTTIEVAGDPLFTRSQKFAALTFTDVSANGTGNSGCAGFVLTEGITTGSLTTKGIDALRFQTDAAFSGKVTAQTVPGALTISEAVRGYQGVTLNAPVVLAHDTEVDAGTGDVRFAGTVDGQGPRGGQSLEVTASGATTFEQNVGSKTALGSLTTQAIAPLKIDQTADSKTIPLYYVAAGAMVKYGIDVAIGANAPRMYLFDTGGNGFFAGYDPAYFTGVPLGTDAVDITYSSGETLDGLKTPTSMTIGTGSQTVSTGKPVDIAAVVSGTNGDGTPLNVNQPFSALPFAGDFGAAFGVQSTTGQQPYENGPFITSPLFQLPGNLSSGYLVQLGPIGTTTPQLTVGVTDALRHQFPYQIPVSELTSNGVSVGNYPNTNNPVLNQFGFSPTYSVSQGSDAPVILGGGPLPTVIDTGGGTTSARLPDPLAKPYEDTTDPHHPRLQTGTKFRAVFPTAQGYPALDWTFVAGDTPFVNEVGYLDKTGAAINVPNVNTGLNLFNDFDVMFDAVNQVIWLRPNGAHSTVSLQSVTTKGAQSYGQNADLNGTYTAGGDFLAVKATTIAGPTAVTTSAAPITFGGDVDSTTGAGNVLSVSARKSTVTFAGTVGAVNPLGGLNIGGTAPGTRGTDAVTAAGAVKLSGSQTNSQTDGLVIGADVTATFAHGGSISNFSGNGVSFSGSAPSSVLKGFDIYGNVAYGIQLSGGNYAGLIISGNTIGAKGETNPWGYHTNGPNAQGIVLGPGTRSAPSTYTGAVISDNTIQYNRRDGIAAPGTVAGLTISGNTLRYNEGNGIEFTGGDFTGTTVNGNTITDNGGDGITLGAGIGQAVSNYATYGTPLSGYLDGDPSNPAANPYLRGHYELPYSNPDEANFYATGGTKQPQVEVTFGTSSTPVKLYLDTGSRGLFITPGSIPGDATSALTPKSDSPAGYIYLNSSNRMYFGNWVETPITFPQAKWVGPGDSKAATAKAPVLLVSYLGASLVPGPGETKAFATFGAAQGVTEGSVTIYDSSGDQKEVQIKPDGQGGYSITIPGGWWAKYDAELLEPVSNFGVGFERSGLGAVPTANGANQSYNVFLNLLEMRSGVMRPGYVVTPTGVTLGLDSTVTRTGTSTPIRYAYTDLAATGLLQGTQSAPDWQASTGRFTYQPHPPARNHISGTGPVSIDLGIPQGILTLPNYGDSSTFQGQLIVDLLNSGGAVSYTFNPKAAPGTKPAPSTLNQMSGPSVSFFNPLPGAYTQNMPPLNQQFFNTGRMLIAGMNYLYDAAGGYLGLYTPTDASPQAKAFKSAKGAFRAKYYQNPSIIGGVTNLSIQNNTISRNGSTVNSGTVNEETFGNGVTVNGTSSGITMTGNVMYDNKAGAGIALTNGGNGGQPAPQINTATLNGSSIRVTGSSQGATDSYRGPFQVQVFASPASDADNVEGRILLGTVVSATKDFTAQFAAGTLVPGDWITAVTTPTSGVPNTSEFSAAFAVTR